MEAYLDALSVKYDIPRSELEHMWQEQVVSGHTIESNLPVGLCYKIIQVVKTNMKYKPSNIKSGRRLFDTDEDYNARCDGLHQHQMDMRQGRVGQEVLACADGCRDLDCTKGNSTTGLDIRNDERRFFAEVKNAHNTDNSSSRSKKFDLLVDAGLRHPDYELVYAVIGNGDVSKRRVIQWRERQILYLEGIETFRYFFGDDMCQDVVDYTKKIFQIYRSKHQN